ncbi:MAG: hypothetical protein ACJA01_003742 [Saprospiraceae bacterium]|jgi:hypothetical protein
MLSRFLGKMKKLIELTHIESSVRETSKSTHILLPAAGAKADISLLYFIYLTRLWFMLIGMGLLVIV